MARLKSLVTLRRGKHLALKRTGRWEYVERVKASGVAIIVATTASGAVLLIEQFRPAIGARAIELPAGLAGDDHGHERESLETAAHRELIEETGYAAGKLQFLTAGPPSAGLSNEIVTFFRATKLRKVEAGGGVGGEKIVVHERPIAGIDGWLKRQAKAGKIIDPKVYAGLYFLTRSGTK